MIVRGRDVLRGKFHKPHLYNVNGLWYCRRVFPRGNVYLGVGCAQKKDAYDDQMQRYGGTVYFTP